METSYAEIVAELTRRRVRASHPRVRVLEYLLKNRCHPTVDRIYRALHEEIPTLSRTTIYNTLSVFQKAGLVRVLPIGENEALYDIQTENHGHFTCDSCGVVYNFGLAFEALTSIELQDFRIQERNIHFTGICPGCLARRNETK